MSVCRNAWPFLTCVFLIGGLLPTLMTPTARAQRFLFRTYTTQDGLVRNEVSCLYQDREGFLWVGTIDGLARYDGTSWTYFTSDDDHIELTVNHMIEDEAGTLWIGTNFAGLRQYRKGRMIPSLVDPKRLGEAPNRVNVIYPRDGTLWIGTDAGLFRKDARGWRRIPSDLPMEDLPVYAILEYPAGHFWIGTEIGLYRMAWERSGRLRVLGSSGGARVHAIVRDRRGDVWVGTVRRLWRFRSNGVEQPLPPELQPIQRYGVLSLRIDTRGNLWIGTVGQGVFKYTPNGYRIHYTEAHGLGGDYVWDILEDHEGNLWFATERGVTKLVGEHIALYSTREGLPDNLVMTLTLDPWGHLWVGTRQGLARLRSGRVRRYAVADGLPDRVVLSLLSTRDGTVWVGTRRGLVHFVPAGDGFTLVNESERTGWSGGRVAVLYRDPAGNLWIGHDRGISRWTRGGFETHEIEPIRRSLVTAIVRDGSGDLWVGFWQGGIVRMSVRTHSGGAWVLRKMAHYDRSNGLPDDHIRSVWQDRNGHLWFGTRYGGVVQFVMEGRRVRAIRHYTTDDGLSANAVFCILQDRRGDFWFGTRRGVNRGRLNAEGRLEIRTLPWEWIRQFRIIDCFEDSAGRLWFATTDGIVRYDPKMEPPPSPPPPIHITRFLVFNQLMPGVLQVMRANLSHWQHVVTFEFAGISFKDETRIRYQYILEGLDRTWSPVTNQHTVHYAHLPPGRYVFKVRARNVDGVWSETPAVFELQIAPPFWQTGWFLLLVTAGITALVVGVHRYRLRKALEIERVRTRIATDLHDDIGSTLSSISILSEVARREMESLSPRAFQLLQRIGESARALLASLRDIVWAMDPEHDSLEDVIQRIRDFAIEVFEASGIEFTLHLPEDHPNVKVPMEIRRDLYLIAKEAIHNVVRHARCRQATVSIAVRGRVCTLVVRDDGVGLNHPERTGTGIRNMYRRAEAIGGILRIESREEGTTVTLEVRLP